MKLVNRILAILALIISAALLFVHYRNQLERRHAEIVQLRTQIVSSLGALQQRLSSQFINAELLRIELRRISDSDDKYQSIERMPRLLSAISELQKDVEEAGQMFEKDEHAKNESQRNSSSVAGPRCGPSKIPFQG